jgi:glycerophosphoryl diester phosphodiesterase
LYVGLLFSTYVPELVDRALELRLDAVHPNHENITAEQVRSVRAKGLQVNFWTVDGRGHMNRAIDMGATAIITDEPALLKQVLEARGAD